MDFKIHRESFGNFPSQETPQLRERHMMHSDFLTGHAAALRFAAKASGEK